MAGKGDTYRKTDPKKMSKGYRNAFGHWACPKCWISNNSKDSKTCKQCGAKRGG